MIRYRALIVRAVITLLLVAAIVWLVDLGQVWSALRALDGLTVAAIIALAAVSWSIGILKWKLLLQTVELRRIAQFHFIGLFYGMVLPGQLAGEAAKTVRLAASGANFGRVSASVVLDRLTGLVGLGLVSGMGLLLSQRFNPLFNVIGAVIFLGTFVFTLALFAVKVPWVTRSAIRLTYLFKRRDGYFRRIAGGLHRFISVWRAYASNVGLIAQTVALGVAFQLANVAIVKVIANGLALPLSYADAAWTFGIVTFATLLPISFGGVGVREFGFVATLGLIGIAAAQALSLSVTCTLVTMLGAFIGLLLEGGSFQRAAIA